MKILRNRALRIAAFGTWRLDLLRRRLIAQDDSVVMLSTSEFELLYRLVRSAGTPQPRAALQQERSATAGFDRTIDNQVSRLRQKLAPDGEELILTVRGQGYMFIGPVRWE